MSVEIKGRQYIDNIKSGRVGLLHGRHILNAANNHGDEVLKELKRVLTTGSRTGRVYSFKGKKIRASAPGEPPAKRSGKLASGFRKKATISQLSIYSNVFSKEGAPYPFFLEDGTKKMEARPYLRVTAKRLAARFQIELGRFKTK